ncbi:hypothetical protein GGX14DRAFT_407704 [Mycena pura]|uniref:Uncharacterized protein n=1 Tax=Mycena pura TaxID=153505 RepID=A0AAD6XYJ1_9AGAR|nr:hypothetical protein GGX14DRAFT_407704 [Mycena pura]
MHSISIIILYWIEYIVWVVDPPVNPAIPVAEWVRVQTLTRWGYGFHGFGGIALVAQLEKLLPWSYDHYRRLPVQFLPMIYQNASTIVGFDVSGLFDNSPYSGPRNRVSVEGGAEMLRGSRIDGVAASGDARMRDAGARAEETRVREESEEDTTGAAVQSTEIRRSMTSLRGRVSMGCASGALHIQIPPFPLHFIGVLTPSAHRRHLIAKRDGKEERGGATWGRIDRRQTNNHGPGESAATAAAVQGTDVALTRRWLCNCRVGREVPRSAYFLPQHVGELKLSGGSVTTLEYIVWNRKTFRNNSDSRVGVNCDDSEPESSFTKAHVQCFPTEMYTRSTMFNLNYIRKLEPRCSRNLSPQRRLTSPQCRVNIPALPRQRLGSAASVPRTAAAVPRNASSIPRTAAAMPRSVASVRGSVPSAQIESKLPYSVLDFLKMAFP